MPKTRSVVVALLHKCENKEISVELKSGDVFKGILIKSEDNMNVQLKKVTHVTKGGITTQMESIFLRGSKISLIGLPDVLKKADIFEKVRKFASQKNKLAKAKAKRFKKKPEKKPKRVSNPLPRPLQN